MFVYMAVTSRQQGKKTVPGKEALISTPGADTERQFRIEELRRQVASGRYRVEPYRLALKILVRALKRAE